MRAAVIALALAGLAASAALADVVTLKDGSKREGKVVKQDAEEVVLEVSQGRLKAQITFKRSEVVKIEKGRTANERLLAELAARRRKLRSRDAAGWLAFARWLERQNGFSKDARAAYEKVISIDKNNAVARRKLGYEKVAGQWLTREEIMIAKGYVRHAGRWVTPEERAKEGKKIENVKIALAEEVRKQQEQKVDADAKARAKWLREMQALADQKAARYQAGSVVGSGGVVLGRYGYGYYGVRTATGEYIPYVQASPGVVYYTTGAYLGAYPYTVQRRTYVTTPITWGVRWGDKHWDVNLSSGGSASIRFVKKKK